MGRFCLVSLLLLSGLLFAQGSDSSTMHVCSEKRPASAGPCAVPPRPVNKFNPVYPEKARQSHREGKVVLGLIVAKDGSARDLRVVMGLDDDLNQAAIGAVARWKFEPATYEGAPVAVEIYAT
jgi:protein TonB